MRLEEAQTEPPGRVPPLLRQVNSPYPLDVHLTLISKLDLDLDLDLHPRSM